MKKTLIMASFLLLACSFVVAAQSQDQTDQQNAPYGSQGQGRHVTMIGCVQQGAEPDSFVLLNVSPSNSNEQSFQGQGQSRSNYDYEESQDQSSIDQQNQDQYGNNMPSELARTDVTFALIPGSRVNLKNYIGQRVEITGNLIEDNNMNSRSGRSITPGQSNDTDQQQPEIRVSSVRPISRSCQ